MRGKGALLLGGTLVLSVLVFGSWLRLRSAAEARAGAARSGHHARAGPDAAPRPSRR